MSPAAAPTVPTSKAVVVLAPPGRAGDQVFRVLTGCMAVFVLVLVALVGWTLFRGSAPSLAKFGLGFLTRSTWDPGHEVFGAARFIFGTFVSSLLALLIAMPLSLGSAVYLTELAPRWLRQPVISMIEMLAAVPSVVFGLWGLLVMVPWLRPISTHTSKPGWAGCHFFRDKFTGRAFFPPELFWPS